MYTVRTVCVVCTCVQNIYMMGISVIPNSRQLSLATRLASIWGSRTVGPRRQLRDTFYSPDNEQANTQECRLPEVLRLEHGMGVSFAVTIGT